MARSWRPWYRPGRPSWRPGSKAVGYDRALGNEIYCLHQKGLRPGDLVIGNSVFSMGFIGGFASSIRTLVGGEVKQVTSVVHDGRHKSCGRMTQEAQKRGVVGITGVTRELVQHAGNVEFLSVGSCVHAAQARGPEQLSFSTSADGQELYCRGRFPVPCLYT